MACRHHTPVSSGRGGRGKGAGRVAERSYGGTAGRGSFSATHCFVIVPVAFCPQLSSRKATRRDRSSVFRGSHSDAVFSEGRHTRGGPGDVTLGQRSSGGMDLSAE